MKKITEQELQNFLTPNRGAEFRPFFSTRVLARLQRYQDLPLIGSLIVYRIFFRRYIYVASFCLLLLLGFCYFEDGRLSLNHLLGLGSFSEDEILNYLNPVI